MRKLAWLVALAACHSHADAAPKVPQTLGVTALLATANTCDGADQVPAIQVTNPGAAKALAIVVEDPDAPGGTFTHWTAWNFPVAATLDPSAAKQGKNDFGKRGWNGPCPPPGKAHRYVFTVYALDAPLDLPDGADKGAVASALAKHAIASGSATGTYQR